MRAALSTTMLLLVACGRFGFDASVHDGGAGEDADVAIAPARVQSGVMDWLDNEMLRTAPIVPVDLARSLLVFNVSLSTGTPAALKFAGTLTANGVAFQRDGVGEVARIVWYVVEWDGWSVQRATTTIDSTENEVFDSLPTPVDFGRSLLLQSSRSGGTTLNDDDLVRAELTSPNQVRFLTGSAPTFLTTVSYQVVEIPSATVQRGIVDLAAGAQTANVIVSPVALDRGWLAFSGSTPNIVGSDGAASIMVRGALAASDTLTFAREGTAADHRIAWQLVELPPARIQQGVEALPVGESTRQVSLAPVDLESTFVFGGGFSGAGGTTTNAANMNVGTAWASAQLTSTTQLVLERGGNTASGTSPWSVIELR